MKPTSTDHSYSDVVDQEIGTLGSSFRIACFPDYSKGNPYQKFFYDALESHGIEYVGSFRVDQKWLKQPGRKVEALHFHWPELAWSYRGNSIIGRLRALAALWRFLAAANKVQKKIFWTVHNLDLHEGSNWADRIGYRILVFWSDLIICHSKHARGELIKRHSSKLPVVVMHHGNYSNYYPAPNNRNTLFQELGLDKNSPTLLCFGQVRPYKGVDLAIETVKQLEDVQLIIAGKVHDKAKHIRRLAASCERIRLIEGFVDEQQLADLINLCEVVFCPYRKITGSGVLLTAWTLGRGVVATDLPFFREMAIGEPEAIALSQDATISGLVNAVKQYLNLPYDRRRDAAYRLSKRYSWERCILPVVRKIHEIVH